MKFSDFMWVLSYEHRNVHAGERWVWRSERALPSEFVGRFTNIRIHDRNRSPFHTPTVEDSFFRKNATKRPCFGANRPRASFSKIRTQQYMEKKSFFSKLKWGSLMRLPQDSLVNETYWCLFRVVAYFWRLGLQSVGRWLKIIVGHCRCTM